MPEAMAAVGSEPVDSLMYGAATARAAALRRPQVGLGAVALLLLVVEGEAGAGAGEQGPKEAADEADPVRSTPSDVAEEAEASEGTTEWKEARRASVWRSVTTLRANFCSTL